MKTDILKLKYLHHSFWFEFWNSIVNFALTMMKLHHNEACKIGKRIRELE
jgi:hypothetical protein